MLIDPNCENEKKKIVLPAVSPVKGWVIASTIFPLIKKRSSRCNDDKWPQEGNVSPLVLL